MDSIVNAPGFLRIRQVLEIIPVCRSSWWQGVKEGRYPAPVRLGPRTTAWKRRDILALCERLGSTDPA